MLFLAIFVEKSKNCRFHFKVLADNQTQSNITHESTFWLRLHCVRQSNHNYSICYLITLDRFDCNFRSKMFDLQGLAISQSLQVKSEWKISMVTMRDLNLTVYRNRPNKTLETTVNQAIFFKILKKFLSMSRLLRAQWAELGGLAHFLP